MKNLYVVLIHVVLFFCSCNLFSQTKLISYKSHSGDMKYFGKSIIEDSYNLNYSNLGMAPERYVTNSKLDSVIIIDDQKSVIVTSVFCKNTRSGNTEKWKPGRDTVYNHSVFSHSNIDSMKKILKKDYHFLNDIDSTIFLKYDTKTNKYKSIPNKKTIKTSDANISLSKEKLMYLLVVSIALFASVSIYNKHH